MSTRILVIGYSGSGKTLTGNILAEQLDTTCTNTGDIIAQDFWKDNGQPTPGIVQYDKDRFRKPLFDFAVARIGADPAYYVRKALCRGAVVTGARRLVEFAACRAMFDICLWKDSPHVTAGATDELRREHADAVIRWCDDAADLGEEIGETTNSLLRTPEVYIVGRYRHWLPNDEWDYERMDAMADEEAGLANDLLQMGLRVFRPILTHAPLDDLWGDGSARRILALCKEKLLRMRPRDAICVREGWRDTPGQPDSEGAEMEIETALKHGLNVLYTQHGDVALRRACEMLLGTA